MNPFGRTAYASGGTASTAAMNNGASNGASIDFTAARAEISDVTAGRISLAALDLMILALIGFYYWTHNVQGGG